jgi:hypothetical protein
MSDYDTDILTRSERQAELLRQHADGSRADDDAAIDWPNIIEEIEAVRQSQLDQIQSWCFRWLPEPPQPAIEPGFAA